jgi:nascent polypeptide-associated complex subunit alpha
MSSVKEELEALRNSGVAKSHADKLKNAAGLSTPEQEEAMLRAKAEEKKAGNYKRESMKILNAGTKAMDSDLDFKVKQNAKKKEEIQKRKEAQNKLKSFKGVVGKEDEKKDSGSEEDNFPKVAPAKKIENIIEPEPKTAVTPSSISNVPSVPSSPKAVEVVAPTPETVSEVDDVPDLEEQVPDMECVPAPSAGSMGVEMDTAMQPAPPKLMNRNEKKARKMMERLGLTPVPGVGRVTIKKRGNQGYFAIDSPTVFEKNGTYVVFGEARQGDGFDRQAAMQQVQAAQQVPKPAASNNMPDISEEEEEVIDETGVNAKDVELVMSQAACSRAKAVAALKENGGDLVNAIMSMTN